MTGVELNKMIQELNLYNKTPEIDTSGKRINTPEINRPALQLTGYLEHFENERVQIIGYVEYTYLLHLEKKEKLRAFERFVASKIPCVVFTTMTEPDEDMLGLACKYQVPVLVTQKPPLHSWQSLFAGWEYSLPLAFPFTGCWWTYTGKAF